MNTNDFNYEELIILNGYSNDSLSELRSGIIYQKTMSGEDELFIELFTGLFEKVKLMTEREWEEMKKKMPFDVEISEDTREVDEENNII